MMLNQVFIVLTVFVAVLGWRVDGAYEGVVGNARNLAKEMVRRKLFGGDDKKVAMRRMLGGDFSRINNVISNLELILSVTTLESPLIIYDAKCYLAENVCVDLYFYFLDPDARCYGFSIGDAYLEGRMNGTKEFFPDDWPEEKKEFDDGYFFEQYILDIVATNLSFECRLPTRVANNLNHGTRPHDTSSLPDGALFLQANSIGFNFTTHTYANTTFSRDPIDRYENVTKQCKGSTELVNFDDVTFDTENLGPVTIGPIEVADLSTEVKAELNGAKKSVAADPLQELLCELAFNVSDAVGDLLATNEYTTDPDWVLKDGFEFIDIPKALLPEQSMNPPDSVKLVDIGDNWLVNLLGLFPDESRWVNGEDPTESFFNGVYDFLIEEERDNTTEPMLYLIDSFLETNIAATKGAFERLAIFPLLEKALGNETVDASEGFKLDTDFGLVDGKTGFIVNLTIHEVYLSSRPQVGEVYSPHPTRNWLDQIYLLGPQTVRIPALALGNLAVELDVTLRVDFKGGNSLIEDGADMSETLNQALSKLDPQVFSDRFSMILEWDKFWAEATALLPIDENAVTSLELGPLLEKIFDCLMSTWYLTPRLTDFKLNGDELRFSFSGAEEEGLYFLILNAVTDLLPILQGLLPGLLEDLVNEDFVNTEIIDPYYCAKAVRHTEGYLPFLGGLMDFIDENLSEDTVATLLDTFFAKEEGSDWNQLISEPIEVFRLDEIPAGGGVNVTLEFLISKLEIQGISPPNFTAFRLLEVNNSLPYYPNYLFNELGLGIEENPVILAVELSLNTVPDKTFDRRRLLDTREDYEADLMEFEEEDYRRSMEEAQELFKQLEADLGRDGRVLQGTSPPTNFPTSAPQTPAPSKAPTTSRPTRSPSTPSPTVKLAGTQYNDIRIELTFGNVYFLVGLLYRIFVYDAESTPLGETLDIWCWGGKMKELSGIKDIELEFRQSDVSIDCRRCDNDILIALADRFKNDSADKEFFDLINELLTWAADWIESLFAEDEWDFTVTNFQRQCQGLEPLEKQYDFGFTPQELGMTYSYAGAVLAMLMSAGVFACCCVKSPHAMHAAGGKKRRVDDEEVYKKNQDILALENMDDNQHEIARLEASPLFNSDLVPLFVRFFVPFMLLANFVLFIIGDTGVALIVDIAAEVAGIPIKLENFASLSVISSAVKVWQSGGYLLAGLLFLMSIIWPYGKIMGMSYVWFADRSLLGFHSRGTLILTLDRFGKWSLAELFFVIFVFVAFNVSLENPVNAFLPEGFYKIEFGLFPQLSLYTFCTALATSLFLSNVIGYYHDKVEKEVAYLSRTSNALDTKRIGVTNWLFTSHIDPNRKIGVTSKAVIVLCGLCVVTIALAVTASMIPSIDTNINGLAGYVIRLQGQDSRTEYSFLFFMGQIFETGVPGQMYLGVVVLFAVLIAPILQMLTSIQMILGTFSLRGMGSISDRNVILSGWCSLEVYIIALVLTVIEVKKISSYLLGDTCDFIQPIMVAFLAPQEVIDNEDVEAGCFGVTSYLLTGAYLTFAAAIFANVAHYSIYPLFLRFAYERIHGHPPPPTKFAMRVERMALALGFAYVSKESTTNVAI